MYDPTQPSRRVVKPADTCPPFGPVGTHRRNRNRNGRFSSQRVVAPFRLRRLIGECRDRCRRQGSRKRAVCGKDARRTTGVRHEAYSASSPESPLKRCAGGDVSGGDVSGGGISGGGISSNGVSDGDAASESVPSAPITSVHPSTSAHPSAPTREPPPKSRMQCGNGPSEGSGNYRAS